MEQKTPIEEKKVKREPSPWPVIVLATALVCIAGIAFIPSFKIQEIHMNRTYFISQSEIVQVAGLEVGQHFLQGLGGGLSGYMSMRYSGAERMIKERFPQLRQVSVRFEYPSVINIDVDERIPVVFIKIPDACALLDRDGVVTEILTDPPRVLPLIEGLTVRSLKIGAKVEVDIPDDLTRSISVLSSLIEADQESTAGVEITPLVRSIKPSSLSRVSFDLTMPKSGQRLTVNCSMNAYLRNNFVWLRRVLSEGVLDDKLPGTLDLSGKYQIFKPDVRKEGNQGFTWMENIQKDPSDQSDKSETETRVTEKP